jgi:hypothetical protein
MYRERLVHEANVHDIDSGALPVKTFRPSRGITDGR